MISGDALHQEKEGSISLSGGEPYIQKGEVLEIIQIFRKVIYSLRMRKLPNLPCGILSGRAIALK